MTIIDTGEFQSGEYFWHEMDGRVHALRCINRYSHNPNEKLNERKFRFSFDLYSSSEIYEDAYVEDKNKLQDMMEPEVSIIAIMFHFLAERIREPIHLKKHRPQLSYHDEKDGRVWHMSFIKEKETASRRHFLFYEKDMHIEECQKVL